MGQKRVLDHQVRAGNETDYRKLNNVPWSPLENREWPWLNMWTDEKGNL